MRKLLELRPLIYFLIHPLFLGVFSLVLGYFLSRTHLGWGRVFWTLGGVWFFVIFFTSLPQRWLEAWEQRYPPLVSYDRLGQGPAPNIVVLASGFTHDTALLAGQQLSSSMLQRLAEGLRLYRQIPGAKMVLSGPAGERELSQARAAALAAVDLGLNYADSFLLEQPRNTFEEARYYAARFSAQTPVILVSSASHLPRAVYLFQSQGFEVHPAPAAYHIKREAHAPGLYRPGFHGLQHLQVLLKELVGLGYARWGQSRWERG